MAYNEVERDEWIGLAIMAWEGASLANERFAAKAERELRPLELLTHLMQDEVESDAE